MRPLCWISSFVFPLHLRKEKICHLRRNKRRNKRTAGFSSVQNHSFFFLGRHNNSFEFMIFNGGNLVWKYLKSWGTGKMSRQAFVCVLPRKTDQNVQKEKQGKKVVVQFSWLPDNLHLRKRGTQTSFTRYSCLFWFVETVGQ